MKTLILIVTMPFLHLFLFNEELDKTNGFGNYKFGTPFSMYTDLNLELDEGDTKLYTSLKKTIHIPGVEFEYIRTTFCKNKLTVLSLETKDGTGTILFQFLQKKYGTPKKIKKEYEWLGNKVQLTYEPYPTGGDAIINFYSK
jgi:hypothetical protein